MKYRAIWTCSAAALALGAATQAHAGQDQGAAAQADGSGLEEIIVTARRTNESLQKTPVALTAFSTADLEKRQLTNVSSLQYQVPSMTVTPDGSSGGLLVSMRGLANTVSAVHIDQTVGLYLDGVYYARAQGFSLDLTDIQRVEVLRGPQGTLFGRNSTGGAVNVITNKPTDQFEGLVRAGFGNYDSREAAVVVNVPLSTDQLGLRVVSEHREHDGYGRNRFLDRGVNSLNQTNTRGTLRIAPTDSGVELLLNASYLHRNDGGQLVHTGPYNPARLPAAALPLVEKAFNAPFYDSYGNRAGFGRTRAWSTSATLSVDLGGVNFKSITGYNGYRYRSLVDYDASEANYLNTAPTTRQSQFSQEFQLNGETGRLKWIAGTFYFKETGQQIYNVFDGLVNFRDRFDHSSIAAFAQGTYELTDRLKLTAGLRWTQDKREEKTNNIVGGSCAVAGAVKPACEAVGRAKFNYPSYTASLDYQATPDILFYVKTSQSHRSGGINISPLPIPFDPEDVTDYELGIKSQFFDRRLRVNADVYYTSYKGMQRTVLSTTGVGSLTQSVGKARIYGMEMDVTAVPVRNLELSATVGLLNPKYLEFRDATGDLSGQPFLFVSKTTYTLAGTYTLPLESGSLAFHADYGFKGTQWFGIPNPAYGPYNRQRGYGVLNGRLTWNLDLGGNNFEVAAWGRNLTKKKYNALVVDQLGGSGIATYVRGDPRTYGLTGTFKF